MEDLVHGFHHVTHPVDSSGNRSGLGGVCVDGGGGGGRSGDRMDHTSMQQQYDSTHACRNWYMFFTT